MILLADQATGGFAALGLNWTGLIFQLINFGILYWVLRKWAFPPILRLLDRRRRQIEEGLRQAAAAEKALQDAMAQRHQVLEAARREATALVETARSEALREGARITAEAQSAAGAAAAQAEQRIEYQRRQARDRLVRDLEDVVAAATASVTRGQLTPKADSVVIKKALQEAAR